MINIINQELYIKEKHKKSSRVDITCPVCEEEGQINIPKYILKNHGLTTISIPSKSLCGHNFQILLDQQSCIQECRRVDHGTVSSNMEFTDFICRICGAKVIFNINNENSYLKKNINKNFLGNEKCSYEVAHYFKDELHINNVIVENDGQFQDYINNYKMKLENYNIDEDNSQDFCFISNEGQKPLESHPFFNTFLIFNMFNNWIFELVSPPQSNIIELNNLLYNKLQEVYKENSTLPEFLNMAIAEENYDIWSFGDNIICINLKEGLKTPWMKSVIKIINNKIKSITDLISKSSRILLVSEFFDSSDISKNHEAIIDRLIFDDLLYSKIEIKFKELIPRIIDRLSSMLSINQDYLASYFDTNLNTVEFLRTTENTDSLEKLLNVIDFVSRRNLLM